MNNPMQANLLPRSPSGGPPISKKQRAGPTPGSIRSRPRPAAPSAAGPPLRQKPGLVVDDAIARRRAELRRLQEKARGNRRGVGPSSSSAPPTTSVSSVPPPRPIVASSLKRTSDIFPTAPKSPSHIPKPTKSSYAAPKSPPKPSQTFPSKIPKSPKSKSPSKSSPSGKKSPSKSPSNISKKPNSILSSTEAIAKLQIPGRPNTKSNAIHKTNPNLPPETPSNGAIPPTPAVGRRLEFPSNRKEVPSNKQPKPPMVLSRARSKSPMKTVAKTASAASASTAAANTATTRARSAPPRRPPGPPPKGRSTSRPRPRTGTHTNSAAETKAADKRASRSRRPAPVRPGTILHAAKPFSAAEGPPPTGPSKTGGPLKGPSSSGPPPTTAPSPPPTDIGTGSLDTSNILEDAALTETPKTQKSIATGSGAETPPSSGSSARRKKLQLMREQAVVASSITKATAINSKPRMTVPSKTLETNAAPPPATTTSFYAGSGQPATSAFASAVAPKANTAVANNHTNGSTNAPPEVPMLMDEANDSRTTNKKVSNNKPPLSSFSSSTTSSKMPTMSAAQARLEDAYQKSERDKIAALTKIKELEEKLSQTTKDSLGSLQETHEQQKLDVRTLLELAETQGPQAALDWARSSNGRIPLSSSPTKPASSFGFNTGTTKTGPEQRRKARIAIRAVRTQGPGSDNGNNHDNNESPELTERRLIRKFREATLYVSYEFSSDLATYTVRRPYGTPTAPGLFAHCRPPKEPESAYAKKAHVSNKATVEVAAITKTDNTPLLVFGNAGIRYQTNPSSKNVPPDWKHFENVDALDRPLGHVTYIDNQGNEKEYSLDEVLEEALLVREQYCGTLTSTALALPEGGNNSAAIEHTNNQQQQQKPPTPKTDVGVGTDTPPPNSKQEQEQQEQQNQSQAPPPDNDSGSSSSDVLVVFLGIAASFVVNLVWGIFIGMPVRILRTTVVLVVVSFLLQILHLYLADGYNDWALREMSALGSSSMVASDLAYFSNKHPGIL